ncbi:MAG: GNAT family N-acyltransferase [Acidiferrobacterales bacterium]|jgi:putative hemolysin|nr:GNAT family N-acyltransferase [Acidiferrobacterales bacterium]
MKTVDRTRNSIYSGKPFKRYEVRVTENAQEILEAQRLRYEVFALEMGAKLESDHLGLDRDRFDHFVKHLIVRDTYQRKIIGYTRILTRDMANIVGGFYSSHEFDLTRIMSLHGNIIEIGRTCIHRDHRRGSTIAMLWSGIARVMETYRADYLIGCASIPMGENGHIPQVVLGELDQGHLASEMYRVYPKTPVPFKRDLKPTITNVEIPPLIKGYLRAGAKICGEPCWDPDFNVADVFICLDRERIDKRYQKRFVGDSEPVPLRKAG